MSETPLFRTAALEYSKVKWMGEILLIRPVSFSILTTTTAIMVTILVIFVLVGSYTKRTTISGQLASDIGILKVFAPQRGVVLKKNVREGQKINKGDLLFIVSTDRLSDNEKGFQAEISGQVALRQQSLRDELSQTHQIQRNEEDALRKKIMALKVEASNIINQLAEQRIRIQLAQRAVERADSLFVKGFISAEMIQQKQADMLDQKNRLHSLERDQITLERDLQAEVGVLSSLPLHQRNQRSQIERLLTSATQERAESESKRRIAITAPESGIATATIAEIGQTVDADRPLLSVLPSGSVLQAHLYAPSRAVGFIRSGDSVFLRYHAYPYQKFGQARGTVASVSRTAMSSTEIANGVNNQEGLFRIIVTLSDQTVTAYGRAHALQPGMQVDADIVQEKRKLYEWMLEPLISLTGKL